MIDEINFMFVMFMIVIGIISVVFAMALDSHFKHIEDKINEVIRLEKEKREK